MNNTDKENGKKKDKDMEFYSAPMSDSKPGNEHRRELHYNNLSTPAKRITETRKVELKGGDSFKFKNGTVKLLSRGISLVFTPRQLRVLWVLDYLQQKGQTETDLDQLHTILAYGGNWRASEGYMKVCIKDLNSIEVEFDIDGKLSQRGYLLPIEYKQDKDEETGAPKFAIRFTGEQPLAKYLRATGQYTELYSEDIFATPLIRSEEWAALENYCIYYVSTAENGEGSLVINHINGPAGTHFAQKKLTDYVRRLFEYYKKIGFITEYSIKFDTKIQQEMLYFKK